MNWPEFDASADIDVSNTKQTVTLNLRTGYNLFALPPFEIFYDENNNQILNYDAKTLLNDIGPDWGQSFHLATDQLSSGNKKNQCKTKENQHD